MAGAPVTSYLRRPSVRWDLFHPEAFADRRAPKFAELNTSTLGVNITCAVDEDSTTFTLGDSELDERYSYCDESGQSRPTRYAPEASIAIFEDKDRAATGVFNTAKAWLLFPDQEFIIVKRVGPLAKFSDTPYGLNDRLKMQLVSTDLVVNELNGDDPALLIQNFGQRGWSNWNYKVTA